MRRCCDAITIALGTPGGPLDVASRLLSPVGGQGHEPPPLAPLQFQTAAQGKAALCHHHRLARIRAHVKIQSMPKCRLSAFLLLVAPLFFDFDIDTISIQFNYNIFFEFRLAIAYAGGHDVPQPDRRDERTPKLILVGAFCPCSGARRDKRRRPILISIYGLQSQQAYRNGQQFLALFGLVHVLKSRDPSHLV